MSFASLKHLLSRLVRSPHAAAAPRRPPKPAPLAFDPAWHGDHWQNLLASPMDARHYVMEDWCSASLSEANNEAGKSVKKKPARINRRSY
jgi:hypothetical protein